MRYVLILLAAGCAANLKVTSAPAGAHVIVDGEPTGEVTPTSLTARELGGDGEHQVGVELEGHTAPAPRMVTVSGPKFRHIAGSLIFPIPVIPVNLIRGYADAEPREVHFDLEKKP